MKAYKTKEGCWQLSYMNDGKQRTIYLGKHQTAVSADRAGRVLSELLLCRKIGESPSFELVKRFTELGPKVRASFERHGIIPDRGAAATVGDLVRMHEPTKSNTKPGTQSHYEDWYGDLKLFFGDDRKLVTITKGDAELMRAWLLAKRELSEATVARGIRTCRSVFQFGVDLCLMSKNPFHKVKTGSDANADRMEYVERSRVLRVAESCRNDEERFVLFLARFAGLRIPCEIRYMKFGDFKEDRFVINNETKTGRREVPFFHELRSTFENLRAGRSNDDLVFEPRHGKTYWRWILNAVERSGVKRWEKLFVNLRSSCITDFAMLGCSEKTLDSIFGNSSFVRLRHYVQFMKDYEIDRLLRDNLAIVETLRNHGGNCDDAQTLEFKLREILAENAHKNILVKFFSPEKPE